MSVAAGGAFYNCYNLLKFLEIKGKPPNRYVL
jgi:hypothetical protein